jgi:hypothetical protein
VVFHILIEESRDTDTSVVESSEKETERTALLWPLSVEVHIPLVASQSVIVLSRDANASIVESCEKLTELNSSK